MAGILVLLFFIAYFFNEKSKEKSRLEVIYYNLLFNHKSDSNKQEEIKSAGMAYGEILGLNQSATDKMISNDLA